MRKEYRYIHELLKDKNMLTTKNYDQIPFDSCILLYMTLTGERLVTQGNALIQMTQKERLEKIKELRDYIWGEDDNSKPNRIIENIKNELTILQGALITLCNANSVFDYSTQCPEDQQCVMMTLVNSKDPAIKYLREREQVLIEELAFYCEEVPSLLKLLHEATAN